MTIVNLKLRNTNISLDCDDVERLNTLANRYNERLEELSSTFYNSSDLKLALIAGLMLEDQIDALSKKIENETDNKEGATSTKKTFNDDLDRLSDYIDDLASRIEKGYSSSMDSA
jgi:cell division protein ZapA (FtsZ GTPase activity inhibitor)